MNSEVLEILRVFALERKSLASSLVLTFKLLIKQKHCNALPNDICTAASLSSFRKLLKSSLSAKVYIANLGFK